MTIAYQTKMVFAYKTKMTLHNQNDHCTQNQNDNCIQNQMFVLELQSDFVHPIKYIKMYSINDKKKSFTFIFLFS